MTYVCPCNTPKAFRLTIDGGSTGNYTVELCKKCHSQEKFQHVVSEIELK